ncbi:MAG TPA: hypothetical protein VMV28_04205 [Thermoplasmata archaeon]|nr:hypothetical protein [Thermoplasmata archaeon]
MPRSTLSRSRIVELLPRKPTEAELEEILFRSKAEIESRDGDALTVSVTPDRLDLLSEGGLALHVAGATGAAAGLPPLSIARRSPALRIEVDGSVRRLRPWIAGVLVTAPATSGLDAGTLAEAIRFQEVLHASVGRDRAAASLGIYPADGISGPIRYAMEPISQVSFVPLDGESPVDAATFFRSHPLAARYGAFGRDGDRCLTMRDANGTILSLPPVLNARGAGEARAGDRTLLLEATGTRARSVQESLSLLLLVFAARGFAVSAVATRGPGTYRLDGRTIYHPRALSLPRDLLDAVLGTPLPARDVVRFAGQARMSARAAPGGWRVQAAPWRSDLLGPIDAVEEVVLARGVGPADALVPPSRTLGGRRPEVHFRRKFLPLLLGLGYQPLYHPVLTSRSSIDRLPGLHAIRLSNAPSAEFGSLRPSLLVSLLQALGANVRYGYPQRICELGPVLEPDARAEAGARTAYHVAAVLAADGAGFATAAALGEYLLRSIDVVGVRESAELPGTIPGRAAEIHVAGGVVAQMGELHPRILEELRVVVPAAWIELDLTALWPLVEAPRTAGSRSVAAGPAPRKPGTGRTSPKRAPRRRSRPRTR